MIDALTVATLSLFVSGAYLFLGIVTLFVWFEATPASGSRNDSDAWIIWVLLLWPLVWLLATASLAIGWVRRLMRGRKNP